VETRGTERPRSPAARWTTAALLALLAASATAEPAAASTGTLGKTTVEQRVVPNSDAGFRELLLGQGEGYVVREEGIGSAQAGRAGRRASLLYFGQLSDFQLADEESPARVEFIDFGPFSAAWRPWEAMNPHIDDAMVRQLNAFAPASPLTAGDASRRPMDFVINTGDIADSQQFNETLWTRILQEGGTIDPGSGVNPFTSGDPACALLSPLIADAGAPGNYTGVQDFDDYVEGGSPQFYDPDAPAGAFASWPQYGGLLDRAQQPFEAAGLDVPSYMSFGNHDALVQGNAAANAVYELVATGCVKPMSPVVGDPDTLGEALGSLNLTNLLGALESDPAKVALVPPDSRRRFVSKQEYKAVYEGGLQADGHGFGLVDAAEETASKGAAGYYAWSPVPGFRFISLDTVSEAGVIGPSADGNIDHPQFQWLRDELEDATAAGELVVLFSHHAIPSLTSDFADELAPACTVADPHGHDVNPGCDLDPRDSAPIHLGDDMTALLHEFPHAIAWVAGHSHVNTVEAYPAPDGGSGFWSIRTAAEADWPQQSRLLEVFDNDDGTLSIFGTIVDHASPAAAPGPGNAAGFSVDQLASVGRTIAYNDTQSGGRACNGGPCGEGVAADRNVELLVADPRAGGGPGPDPYPERCGTPIRGTRGPDRLVGTAASERIRALAGRDRLLGGGGRDCLGGGRGNDRIRAFDGTRDVVRCGRGKRDRAGVDGRDRVRGCERVAVAIP
jgi:3',5'-cyclic AMP phosphodiesterase CpdA